MDEKMFIVRDSSATQEAGERCHVINFNGEFIEVKFRFGQDTVLPEAKAMKFLQPGFDVFEVGSGYSVTAPPSTPYGAPPSLAPDEVIAKFEELSTEALRTRCAIRPSGESLLSDDVSRETMIEFLSGLVAGVGIPQDSDLLDEENGDIEDDEDEYDAPKSETGNENASDNGGIQEQTEAEDDGSTGDDQDQSGIELNQSGSEPNTGLFIDPMTQQDGMFAPSAPLMEDQTEEM